MPVGRGPQVLLDGTARDAARGAAGRTMAENIAIMDALERDGLVPDGTTVDGSTRTGAPPEDVLLGIEGPAPPWLPVDARLLPTSPVGLKAGNYWFNSIDGVNGVICAVLIDT